MYQLSIGETIIRLSVAAILGSIIGFERQRKDGPAGLRTHMLVCLGSALVMLVSAFGFSDVLGKPAVVLDPSRVAAQVISGIGFLGAGTIFMLRPRIIRGLTTAAGLWTVAAIGLAVGGGLYLAAIAATVIVLIILAVIKPLETLAWRQRKKQVISVILDSSLTDLDKIISIIKKYNLDPAQIHLTPGEQEGEIIVKIHRGKGEDAAQVLEMMAALKTINASPATAPHSGKASPPTRSPA